MGELDNRGHSRGGKKAVEFKGAGKNGNHILPEAVGADHREGGGSVPK